MMLSAHRLYELFVAALDRPPEQRSAFLDSACGGDLELRAKIERFLAHHLQESEKPLFNPGPLLKLNLRGPGADAPQLPGYELLRELNRGGQGVVYEAIQQATKQKVAIKVLLAGPYASPTAHRRFEREIELVAQLRHRNIVSIFDASQTPDGRQFCVMEYVRGMPLHEFVTDNRLPLKETLRLFCAVCEAVQYAHQKGVIHRDLKPSNILVDASSTPRLLDFGLAKWLAAPADPLDSTSERVLGTVAYMSPEQARGNPDEIDTRTDVYALGVMLYELLTGHYPYPVVGQLANVLKHIAETPPTPPRRSWAPDVSVAKRSSGKAHIAHCPIDDELETIVLRALAKERQRRYQSAGELGRDIEHYLAGEPIEAKRDSNLYVLKKQLQRYKLHVTVAVAFLVVLMIGLMTSASLWLEARREREVARSAELEQGRERRRADEQAEEARQRRAEAEASRRLAENQTREAEWQSYLANIVAADAALRNEEAWVVRHRLGACPESLRGWEWRFLSTEANQSLYRLRSSYPMNQLLGDQTSALPGMIRAKYLRLDFDTGMLVSPLFEDGSSINTDAFCYLLGVTACGDRCLIGESRRDHNDAGFHTYLAIYDTERRAVTARIITTERLLGLHAVISSDGRWVAVATEPQRGQKAGIRILGGEDLVELDSLDLESLSGPVQAMCFAPDGEQIAAAGTDSTIKVWDVQAGSLVANLSGLGAAVSCLAFTPDGKQIVSGASDGTVLIHELPSGRCVQSVTTVSRNIAAVAVSPTGHMIAVAMETALLQLVDARTRDTLAVYRGLQEAPRWLAFMGNGAFLVSGRSRNIAIWDATVAVPRNVIHVFPGPLEGIVFGPCDEYLAVASGKENATCLVYLPRLGISKETEHSGRVRAVTVSEDGALIASGDGHLDVPVAIDNPLRFLERGEAR